MLHAELDLSRKKLEVLSDERKHHDELAMRPDGDRTLGVNARERR
jgi:hypothetical protein